MPKIIDYVLVTNTNGVQLTEAVAEFIKDGYVPFGSPISHIRWNAKENFERDFEQFVAQAVVLYKEPNPNDESPTPPRFCIVDSWDTAFITKRGSELLALGWLPTGNLVYRCNDQGITEEARHYYAQAFYLPPEVLA